VYWFHNSEAYRISPEGTQDLKEQLAPLGQLCGKVVPRNVAQPISAAAQPQSVNVPIALYRTVCVSEAELLAMFESP